jgi:hypothetical protein
MTKEDKINFLYFITRTGMYINPVDDKNVVSFIYGYELGRKKKCDFTKLSKELLIEKYKIQYSNDGFPGQITRLAKKLSLNWVTTFKRIALEIVVDERQGDLDKVMMEILRTRIISLLKRVDQLGDICFNDNWTEEWLTICPVKSKWCKQLWTDIEWKTIKSIDKLIQADSIFDSIDKKRLALELLEIIEKYNKQKSTNQ